eukprot:scaffold987_cov39-Cyclotella_meneghiniana.AAC.3
MMNTDKRIRVELNGCNGLNMQTFESRVGIASSQVGMKPPLSTPELGVFGPLHQFYCSLAVPMSLSGRAIRIDRCANNAEIFALNNVEFSPL